MLLLLSFPECYCYYELPALNKIFNPEKETIVFACIGNLGRQLPKKLLNSRAMNTITPQVCSLSFLPFSAVFCSSFALLQYCLAYVSFCILPWATGMGANRLPLERYETSESRLIAWPKLSDKQEGNCVSASPSPRPPEPDVQADE